MVDVCVTLRIKKNNTEYQERTVFGSMDPVGHDEFAAAGQNGYKADCKVEIWGFEYNGETEIQVNGRNYVVYRTYGPKSSGKIELYAGERVGKR